MMKLIPVLTEKSLKEAENGKYTFWVGLTAKKTKIKYDVENIFGVKVMSIKTAKKAGKKKKNYKGRIRNVKPRKKAIVTLKGKDKIDLFEPDKKSAKKKK